ncbi:MAG: D-alanine--D-alanine ligase [Gemmatales bacterium]|nr:D-alanine--D-alanine ligase [Gemmatales bacterium]MDW8387662.1 D-alanine--D-alanine ligase [Gemmatales bacterium]
MRIGITFDLKSDGLAVPGQPDDFQEEFDSPQTVEAVAEVFRRLGHQVVLLGDGPSMLRRLLDDPPDFVFNFAEGHGIGRSREARVPAVLEMLGIPFSGSDPLTLAVTLDKEAAKTLVAAAGVSVPRGRTIRRPEEVHAIPRDWFPVLLKPAWEGSSKGIRRTSLVEHPSALPETATEMLRSYRQPILIEEFVAGEEITVGIVGNESPEIVGVMQVLPRRGDGRFIYGLEVKRDYRNQVDYACPPRLPQPVVDRIAEAALTCYRALGCRDVSRVDFRLRNGEPVFLEVNPLPGLHPVDSDLVIMARLAGWSYDRLIGSILDAALSRQDITAPPRPCEAGRL